MCCEIMEIKLGLVERYLHILSYLFLLVSQLPKSINNKTWNFKYKDKQNTSNNLFSQGRGMIDGMAEAIMFC